MSENPLDKMPILVMGMGSWAYGKERRAVSTLKHMHRVKPYFLISQWEDGSVSRLLREHHFEFSQTSLGYLGRKKPLWTLVNLIQWPRLHLTVLRTYLKKRCRLILVLDLRTFVNTFLAIFILKRFANARAVLYLGDIPMNDKIHRFLAKLINRFSDRLIANSEAVKQGLVSIGIEESKIEVIYNGVDLGQFDEASPLDFRQTYGWPADAFLIGYVGQFRPNKGVMDFVKTAEWVLQKNRSCRFVMIGKAESENGCWQAVADCVKSSHLDGYFAFPGYLDDIERAYRGFDILVVPSRHEDPAPNVNIEAMASGIPVIATRVGGSPEIVVEGVTGFLVDKGCPDQIAERILQLAGEVELRKKMGESGKERMRQLFDIRKNAYGVEEVLGSVDI